MGENFGGNRMIFTIFHNLSGNIVGQNGSPIYDIGVCDEIHKGNPFNGEFIGIGLTKNSRHHSENITVGTNK